MGVDPLQLAYARLLRCYPRWYRRERGAEILTTLIDAAQPGQRRPTRADVVDLLLGALRCRLRRAPAMVVTAALAVLTGTLGSAAATHLSGYPGPPSVPAAVAVARTAVGEVPRDVPGPVLRCNPWCPQTPADGDDVVAYDYAPDYTDLVEVAYDMPRDRVADVVTAARGRLTAAGWRVRPAVAVDGQQWFEATRGGLAVTVRAATDPQLDAVSVQVSKASSTVAGVLAGLGFLVGAALGTLVHRRAVLRYRRHRLLVRAPAAIAAGLVVVVVAPFALLTARYVYVMTALGQWRPKDVQVAEFVLVLFPELTLTVVLAAVTALVLVGTRPRGRLAVRSAR
jgi:hypothetical protein